MHNRRQTDLLPLKVLFWVNDLRGIISLLPISFCCKLKKKQERVSVLFVLKKKCVVYMNQTAGSWKEVE